MYGKSVLRQYVLSSGDVTKPCSTQAFTGPTMLRMLTIFLLARSRAKYVGVKQYNTVCGPSTETVSTLSVQVVGTHCMSAPEC